MIIWGSNSKRNGISTSLSCANWPHFPSTYIGVGAWENFRVEEGPQSYLVRGVFSRSQHFWGSQILMTFDTLIFWTSCTTSHTNFYYLLPPPCPPVLEKWEPRWPSLLHFHTQLPPKHLVYANFRKLWGVTRHAQALWSRVVVQNQPHNRFQWHKWQPWALPLKHQCGTFSCYKEAQSCHRLSNKWNPHNCLSNIAFGFEMSRKSFRVGLKFHQRTSTKFGEPEFDETALFQRQFLHHPSGHVHKTFFGACTQNSNTP